jgi:hypothetical protein
VPRRSKVVLVLIVLGVGVALAVLLVQARAIVGEPTASTPLGRAAPTGIVGPATHGGGDR